jgi:Leucine-rich repeat (LRR) protein
MSKTPMRKTRKNIAGRNPKHITPVQMGFDENPREELKIEHHSKGLKSLSKTIKKELLDNFAILTELNLANNQLKELPDYIGKLVNLKVLNLGQNKFKVFPSVILKLINLEELYLNNNDLESLPENIEVLNKLNLLKLDNNPRLNKIPESIFEINNNKNVEISINGTDISPHNISSHKKTPHNTTIFTIIKEDGSYSDSESDTNGGKKPSRKTRKKKTQRAG